MGSDRIGRAAAAASDQASEGRHPMPGPFPGIDPYIESQGYWPDFHAAFNLYCRDALNEILPDSYEARLGEQLRLIEVAEPLGRTVLPDVAVIHGGPGPRPL